MITRRFCILAPWPFSREPRGMTRKRPIFLLTLGVMILSGCGGHYEHLSAGSVGCDPNDITIDGISHNGGTASWDATCNGKTFVCTETPAEQVSCAKK